MIDFSNAAFVKLTPANIKIFGHQVQPLLLPGEEIIASYQALRDGVVFTDKRIITVNIQGISGKKMDMTSLPYNKIQAFSVESAGTIDFDSELDIWFAGIGKIRLEFAPQTDITDICQLLSAKIL